MTFLIGKIFVYMLLSLGLGAAAGWLWRHQQADSQEGALERALLDARGRVPQMESALRVRDEQIEALNRELQSREATLEEYATALAARDHTVAELERACAELQGRLEQASAHPAPATEPDVGELALHPGDPADVADAPVGNAAEHEAVAAALAGSREALEAARQALSAEQRRVAELTRERQLQHQALKALEQQLDLARDSQHRVANG